MSAILVRAFRKSDYVLKRRRGTCLQSASFDWRARGGRSGRTHPQKARTALYLESVARTKASGRKDSALSLRGSFAFSTMKYIRLPEIDGRRVWTS